MLRRTLEREITGEIVRWLNWIDGYDQHRAPAYSELIPPLSHTWDDSSLQTARRVIFTQGLGAILHSKFTNSGIGESFPNEFLDWLEQAHQKNQARNTRFFEELHTLLAQANRDSIEVMPLKGILLAQKYYPDPGLRPMADLDLLVHAADRQRFAEILTQRGYRYIPSPSIYPNHDYFLNAGGDQVVDYENEHPDNPRPVEVHIAVRRSLWGDIGVVDLTDSLWAGSVLGELVGEKVRLPNRLSLLNHILVHATQHFLISTGRMSMWVDLAALAPQAGEINAVEYSQLAYPVLRLAQRALPEQLGSLDLSEIAISTHPSVRHWSDHIPLDDRCGLVASGYSIKNRPRLFWSRWKPEAWRMALGYSGVPLPVAYLKHGAAFFRHIPQRVR